MLCVTIPLVGRLVITVFHFLPLPGRAPTDLHALYTVYATCLWNYCALSFDYRLSKKQHDPEDLNLFLRWLWGFLLRLGPEVFYLQKKFGPF